MNLLGHRLTDEVNSLLLGRFRCSLLAAACLSCGAGVAAEPPDPYDVLYNLITIRRTPDGKEYGTKSPSPLIWTESTHLLEETTYGKLITALDRFDALSSGEINEYAPVKRAIIQQHLWAVFDWASHRRAGAPESREFTIQQKIARLLRRLALSEQQIDALPDPIAATAKSGGYPKQPDPTDSFRPFFPQDLYGGSSPWVCVRRTRSVLPAVKHSELTDWRSVFLVFIRLPGDRKATIDYINTLSSFRETLIGDERGLRLNPNTPQFPVGTQFALAERPLLISDKGEPVLSPLCFRIQLRGYLNTADPFIAEFSEQPTQALAEFAMQPRKFMQGDYLMEPVVRNQLHYVTFFTNDPFQRQGRSTSDAAHLGLSSCMNCHGNRGILSVNSRAFPQLDTGLPAHFREGTAASVATATAIAKKATYAWGRLEGLWLNAQDRE